MTTMKRLSTSSSGWIVAAVMRLLFLSSISKLHAYQPPSSPPHHPVVPNTRRAFLNTVMATTSAVTLPFHPKADAIPEQKSYSTNARNLNRLSSGDASGGSVYDNHPSTPAAAKRRAMIGCKVSAARTKASMASEKECNVRVLGGDYEFMLHTLDELDCPTCPYGINGA
mmetsp:Transcript_37361/g.77516  ORF Transcript_37361/g.77516 Transcript_37361/m.77516 type:complete len:169 (-) Transcript_37361:278-784(-)